MDWTIELIDRNECLLVTTKGKFSISEQKEMFQDITLFPAWNRQIPILFDNRQLNLVGSNAAEMRESATINEKFVKDYAIERLAGLVNDGVNFGFGRQFEILFEIVGGDGFRLFKDFDLALAWLRKETD